MTEKKTESQQNEKKPHSVGSKHSDQETPNLNDEKTDSNDNTKGNEDSSEEIQTAESSEQFFEELSETTKPFQAAKYDASILQTIKQSLKGGVKFPDDENPDAKSEEKITSKTDPTKTKAMIPSNITNESKTPKKAHNSNKSQSKEEPK